MVVPTFYFRVEGFSLFARALSSQHREICEFQSGVTTLFKVCEGLNIPVWGLAVVYDLILFSFCVDNCVTLLNSEVCFELYSELCFLRVVLTFKRFPVELSLGCIVDLS